MSRHVYGKQPCPSCEEKLLGCHPKLRDVFNYMREIDWMAHCSWGYRGKKDQDEFFRTGRSQKKYPESKHNKTTQDGRPCSEAIDVFFLETPGTATFRQEYYEMIWEELPQEMKDKLRWGRAWGDTNHFELKTTLQSSPSGE